MLIDWVKKRVCDVTEEDMSGIPADRPRGSEDRRLVRVRHVSSREFCRIGDKMSCSNAVWSLPLGVVLKRVIKGIWWMPWH